MLRQPDGGEQLRVNAEHLRTAAALARQAEVHLALGREGVCEQEVGAELGRLPPLGARLVRVVEVAEHPDLATVHPHVLVGAVQSAIAFDLTVVAAVFAIERVLHPPGNDVVEQCGSVLFAQFGGAWAGYLRAGLAVAHGFSSMTERTSTDRTLFGSPLPWLKCEPAIKHSHRASDYVSRKQEETASKRSREMPAAAMSMFT